MGNCGQTLVEKVEVSLNGFVYCALPDSIELSAISGNCFVGNK